MKTRWSVAGFVLLMSCAASGDALACGDKFLVPSRGLRFELTPAARERAAILVYGNPATSLPGLFTRLSVDPALRKAGYRPTVVATAGDLDRSLRQTTWDVVLLDLADGPLNAATAATGGPAVLAVAVNAKDNDINRVKKQYAGILKSPTRSQAFVNAFDAVVASQQAARAKAAKKSS